MYYIDIELSDFNLKDYINSRCLIKSTAAIDDNQIKSLEKTEALLKQQGAWIAMIHISEGLLFLHKCNFVQRPETKEWHFLICATAEL